jgi:hypothetical protein
MRSLSLTPYPVAVLVRDEATGQIVPKPVQYQVAQSCVNLLFAHKTLSADAVLARAAIAEKIRGAVECVLLEEAEYLELLKAVNGFQGFEEKDVEFIRRVRSAPQVTVQALSIVPPAGRGEPVMDDRLDDAIDGRFPDVTQQRRAVPSRAEPVESGVEAEYRPELDVDPEEPHA